MDPIAHTFFGATLAETGLRRVTKYATPTLILGANAPDIDVAATFLGRDMSLYLRRGWTHGVLAMVVLPAVLVGVILLWDRLRGRDGPDDPPLRLGWLFALAYISTWSHPTLDWMNTYGVRLLMPFDGTWFYGDTLFIIDPWFWLMTAAGVVLARSKSWRSLVGWVVLALLASALVFFVPFVPIGVKVMWTIGVAVIVGLRWRSPADDTRRKVARAGLTSLIVYIGILYGMGRVAEMSASESEPPIEAQANPMPGVPWEHRVVLKYETHYRVIPPHEEPFEVKRVEPDEVVRAAMRADSVKGFMNWTRFPYWNVEESDDGYTVTFRDLRYVDPGEPPRGIGLAEVKLNRSLEEVSR